MDKDHTIDEEDFNCFLEWLDPDRDAACAKYFAIRRSLVKFFTCRGCYEADDCADETFNRVIPKVRKIRETYTGNPALYFYGVAKNVYREWLRKNRPQPEPAPPPPERDDLALDCLDACLAELPKESREIAVEYYREDGRAKIRNRKKLALTLGITRNALCVKACNIRASLRRCVTECVRQGAA